MEHLTNHDIPGSPVNDLDEVRTDNHIQERGIIVEESGTVILRGEFEPWVGPRVVRRAFLNRSLQLQPPYTAVEGVAYNRAEVVLRVDCGEENAQIGVGSRS